MLFQIEIANGVQVPESKLALLRHDRPTQLARQLMDVLFTREEMSVSSVTGRPSNKMTGQPVKAALDPVRVNALLCKLHHFYLLYMCSVYLPLACLQSCMSVIDFYAPWRRTFYIS